MAARPTTIGTNAYGIRFTGNSKVSKTKKESRLDYDDVGTPIPLTILEIKLFGMF
jgi:hypothetical protein